MTKRTQPYSNINFRFSKASIRYFIVVCLTLLMNAWTTSGTLAFTVNLFPGSKFLCSIIKTLMRKLRYELKYVDPFKECTKEDDVTEYYLLWVDSGERVNGFDKLGVYKAGSWGQTFPYASVRFDWGWIALGILRRLINGDISRNRRLYLYWSHNWSYWRTLPILVIYLLIPNLTFVI